MFRCDICNFSSNLKTNYIRHLNTKKHLKNLEKCEIFMKSHHEMNQYEPKMNQNEPKMNQNEPVKKKEYENSEIKNKNFNCRYCGESFLTKPSMRRHELHRCKYIKNDFELDFKNQLKLEKIEKRKLYKQIEKLLEDNGKIINSNITNTTINNNIQQNNIVINNYGEEDISHITSNVLDKLITTPADMINNLTKMIHFNKNKPENMNMYIPSRKQKFIKVFRKNKWMLEKKQETIPDLIDRNYNIIDSYYEDHGGSEKLAKDNNKYYKNYQKLIDDKNDKIIKQEYDSCELEILNNSDMVMDQHNIK